MVMAKFMGRMGNVCFQMAAAIAYALKHDVEFTVPTQTNSDFKVVKKEFNKQIQLPNFIN